MMREVEEKVAIAYAKRDHRRCALVGVLFGAPLQWGIWWPIAFLLIPIVLMLAYNDRIYRGHLDPHRWKTPYHRLTHRTGLLPDEIRG